MIPLVYWDSKLLLSHVSRISKMSLLGEGIGSAYNDILLCNIAKPKYFEDDKKALQKILFVVNLLILGVFYRPSSKLEYCKSGGHVFFIRLPSICTNHILLLYPTLLNRQLLLVR